ncbi:MAG: TolC family protein, partial [Proteobacteria bacterium]|nr:TolC family protein [Pseudomonadota bacterium]
NLLFVGSARAITGEMLSLLRRLESVATARYETGKTSFQDVIKVRIQRETLEEDLTTLAERQRTLEAKLREILSLPPETPLGAPAAREPERSVPELDPLYAAAGERRQELRRMRAMVGKMERMIEMAETMIQPGYSLNLSLYADEAVSQVGTFRAREPFAVETTASSGAGLPKMPWYGTSDAYVRETRQKLLALRQELRRAEDATSFGVREAWSGLDLAAREERLYAGSVVDLSQAALEVSTRGYETGRVMFADVIASYTNWLRAKLALERRRADLGVARAELEEAVGSSPLGP